MNLINTGDFLELLTKLKQRGIKYFFSKITFNSSKRTQSTFRVLKYEGSNWWIIPEVKQRENKKIAGDIHKTFDKYLLENYFTEGKNLKLLSVGCGLGNREIRFAETNFFAEIIGIDLSADLIENANKKVREKTLQNIRFEQADFYNYQLKKNYFDVILFHSSLHHFKQIDKIATRVKDALKDGGILVLNEYMGKNRLQFSKDQLLEMNNLLEMIPKQYKKRYLTRITKKRVYAPGLIRMIISDPSEAVESETIKPSIHKYFSVIEEKKIGGDLLMMVLKDIAHNFINSNDEISKTILHKLFEAEDQYLQNTKNADFIFGIYKQKSKSEDV
ncbi:MAG TPA: methyltransferase domain-containing protein [Draconibacterium sp.]|nr:methyltransferase domain-containing protein [Draconibacterium sp.]